MHIHNSKAGGMTTSGEVCKMAEMFRETKYVFPALGNWKDFLEKITFELCVSMVISKVGLIAILLESGKKTFGILFMSVIRNVKNCILTGVLYMIDADTLLYCILQTREFYSQGGLIMVPSLVQ